MSTPEERRATGWRPRALAAGAGALLLLSACSAIDSSASRMLDAVTPYRPDVIQGNFISAEQVQAVRPGMSRLQVRDILGTPLVSSAFHADRWDYVFTMRRQGVPPQQFKLTAFFEGDALARLEGDDMPSEEEFVRRIDGGVKKVKVPQLEAKPEQLQKFRESAAKSAPPPDADDEDLPSSAAPQAYPPLESAR